MFPRRTNATPDDEFVHIGHPGLFRPEVDEVHISVTFQYDVKESELIRKAWEEIGYISYIGGPAIGDPGEEFIPGQYLKYGYVITSRGCPNKCWFCDVWKREGNIREIPITEGWNVLDSNILACSDKHILNVFDMLSKQSRKPEFTGGLDPARITLDIAQELKRLNPRYIYTAYDTPEDYENLVQAVKYFISAGFAISPRSHRLMCYVLIGYPKDTIDDATDRLKKVMELGLTPMAMLYRKQDELLNAEWRRFQRLWARPKIIHAKKKV